VGAPDPTQNNRKRFGAPLVPPSRDSLRGAMFELTARHGRRSWRSSGRGAGRIRWGNGL